MVYMSSIWFFQVYSQLLVAGATATHLKNRRKSNRIISPRVKTKNICNHLDNHYTPLKLTKSPPESRGGFRKVYELLLGFAPIFKSEHVHVRGGATQNITSKKNNKSPQSSPSKC